MQESCRKGVANHPDPEPCEGGRKDAREALDRGICRLGIPKAVSSEITQSGSRRCQVNRKAIRRCATTRVRRGPAESKTPGMHRNSTRENREAPLPSVGSRRGPLGEGDEL
jgi:hypothetical protein